MRDLQSLGQIQPNRLRRQQLPRADGVAPLRAVRTQAVRRAGGGTADAEQERVLSTPPPAVLGLTSSELSVYGVDMEVDLDDDFSDDGGDV